MTDEQKEIVVRHARRVIERYGSREEAICEDYYYRKLFALADKADELWEVKRHD